MTLVTCLSNVLLSNGRGVALAGTVIDLPPQAAEQMEREGHVKRVTTRSAPMPVESEPSRPVAEPPKAALPIAPETGASRPTVFPAPMPQGTDEVDTKPERPSHFKRHKR